MKRKNWMKLFAPLGVALCLAVSASADDLQSSYTSITSSQETSFTMLIKGDVTGFINTIATQTDPDLNPFYYVNKNYFGGTGTTSVITSLIGGNTQVVFTGSNPILQSYQFVYGGASNGQPDFGLQPMNGGPSSFDVLSQKWSSESPFSAASVDQPQNNSQFEIIFATSSDGSHQTGAWYEVPFNAKFKFSNNGPDKITLNSVGYFVTSTQIPLDDLNFANTPPPGDPGSPFSSLSQYDGMSIDPGGSIEVDTPEPATLIMLGSAVIGVTGVLRRKILAGPSSQA